MSVKSPSHITVALPEGVSPSYEMSEVLIKRFLKACKKENIAENVFEKSHLVKRFERPAETERQRRIEAKRRALKQYNDANKAEGDDKNSKKKKQNVNRTPKENKDG